ncbi:MAG: hypothetical protein R6X20_10095 [Phycisphaerae bacterium]
MTHLTDEELEAILLGDADGHSHLEVCALCRSRLEALRAVRGRLRKAFDGIQSSDVLRQTIRANLGQTADESGRQPVAMHAARSVLVRLWPVLAAAAVLALAVLVTVQLYRPPSAAAAQMELVTIHQQNLSAHGAFYAEADPAKLAEYFKTHLGFQPRFPHLGEGLRLRGCCKAHFRDEIVGSYVVETPQGVISVIVVTDTPKSLGLRAVPREGKPSVLAGAYARCRLAARRVGDYTYCVVGETSLDLLADLLDRLVTPERD